MKKYYELPELNYKYSGLEPYVSQNQLKIHHSIHHQGYVNSANEILKSLEKARNEKLDLDMKATLKALSFNVGGHVLHKMMWENLAPENNGGGGNPKGIFSKVISEGFGDLRRFKKEFEQATIAVEGSGWGALTYCRMTKQLVVMQIEKHNVNFYPNFEILMVLDAWEHAYYLDYQNKRGNYVGNFWKIVNWKTVEQRFERLQ